MRSKRKNKVSKGRLRQSKVRKTSLRKSKRTQRRKSKKYSRKTRRSFIKKSRKNNRKLKGGMHGAPMGRVSARNDIYLTVKTHTSAVVFYGPINKNSNVEELVEQVKEINPTMSEFVLHKTIPKYLGFSYKIGEQLKEGTLSDNGVSDGDILSAVFTNTLSSQGELDDRAMGGLGP